MPRVHIALLVALVAALPIGRARPCGALFSSETSRNPAIAAQRALMIVGERTIALHLQLATTTEGEGFSWIVPVPEGSGAPAVALGDQAVFDALDALTTPSVTVIRGGSGGGLCGDSGKSDAGANGPRGGVQHFGGAELGPYTYDIIGGRKVEDIVAWLGAHGYVVPPTADEALAPYAEHNVFVAVRLSKGPPLTGAVSEPLRVSWPRAFEGGLGYAFGLSKLSASEVMPLVLWVLADKRQRVANYGSIEVEQVGQALRDDGGDYPEAVDRLTTAAGGRLMVTEYARDIRSLSIPPALAGLVSDDAYYLTRFYASVPRSAIEDLVITFAADAPDVDPRIEISDRQSPPVAFAALVALFWIRRRTRRSRD